MNDFELFLKLGAVVKINRHRRDDLYDFIKCMLNVGFLKEYIVYFINSCKICGDEKVNIDMSYDEIIGLLNEEYTDDYFWHLVDINEGTSTMICIEYQIGKGFTFGKEKDYRNYDETIKICNVGDIIKALDLESLFGLGYEITNFENELGKDKKDLADELDDFCDIYEYRLVKYKNGTYNILYIDVNELRFVDETVELKKCVKYIYYRMFDYFVDESDIEGLIEEGSFDYVEKVFNTYLKLGRKYFKDREDYFKYNEKLLEDYREYAKEVEDE